MKQKLTDFLKSFLMWFAIFYLIMWAYDNIFGEENGTKPVNQSEQNIIIKPTSKDITLGNVASWTVENQGTEAVTLASPCDTPDSLNVYRLTNGKRFLISDFSNCDAKKISGFSISPQEKITFSLRDFNNDLFSEAGHYFLELNLAQGEASKTVESTPIEFENPGFFRKLFRGLISKPLFNILVSLTQVIPGHSLGWAIVLLTIFVRLLLFAPNQKAMRSQRELQKLQPKLAELKKKYGKNQQALAMKTMELYKTHKVNPMSSCLPMLVQLPVMLGVYYIVQDGVSWHMSYLLYSFNQGVDLTNVIPHFFGMDLQLIPSGVLSLSNLGANWQYLFLPLFVAGMQWVAIKMSFIQAKKRKKDQPEKTPKKSNEPKGLEEQMQSMTGIMQWAMPAMIAFFSFTFPAAVGIYWVTSTIFSIGQQKYVNWKLDQQPQVRKKIS